MSTTEQLHGQWWAADDPSHKVPGVLTLSDTAEPQLDAYATLLDFHAQGFHTLHGESGGRAVSLFDTYVESGNHTFRNGQEYNYQTMKVSGVIIGNTHINGADDPSFTECVLEVDYLTYWARGVELSLSRAADETEGTYTFTVPVRSPRSAQYGNVQVTVSTSPSYTIGGRFSRKEMSIPAHFKTVFQVTSDEPISITAHLEVSRRLADLVTLAMHQPAHMRRISFMLNDVESDRRQKFDWWGTDPVGEDIELDSRSTQRINFTLDDVDLKTLLTGWHELHQTANYGMLSLIALQRESTTYYETRLLGVCGAIEALHKGFHPKWPNYFDRCRSLAEMPPSAAVHQIIPDIDVWARCITNARNHLAHGDEPHERRMPESVWYGLYEPAVALLVLVVMTKLGIPESAQLKALREGALKLAVATAAAMPTSD